MRKTLTHAPIRLIQLAIAPLGSSVRNGTTTAGAEEIDLAAPDARFAKADAAD
ncbi:MAG: hypothetical protein IPJ61_10125 [Tessaracoccus sp.]|uniref:hypothetical protein n=1 Tax=Tessaracoccus sp. TaxID=1971211 RepID=UPI001ED160BE|nr:hypothetical protein [Tessaracoccus sp.]MBK7821411.1 hypothetical protein [Tessaracoccus sp.]